MHPQRCKSFWGGVAHEPVLDEGGGARAVRRRGEEERRVGPLHVFGLQALQHVDVTRTDDTVQPVSDVRGCVGGESERRSRSVRTISLRFPPSPTPSVASPSPSLPSNPLRPSHPTASFTPYRWLRFSLPPFASTPTFSCFPPLSLPPLQSK